MASFLLVFLYLPNQYCISLHTLSQYWKCGYSPIYFNFKHCGSKEYYYTYPEGKGGAPSCCPGASTWHTAKCCVISCMSSKLKKVLKQDLSVGQTHKMTTPVPDSYFDKYKLRLVMFMFVF